jgi:outer membrane protein assembly factor BamB
MSRESIAAGALPHVYRRRLLTAGAALALAACATEKKTKPAELVEFQSKLRARVAWRTDVGSARGAYLQPAVLENAIYAAAADGTLMRLDPGSGRTAWRVDVGAPVAAGVGSDGFSTAVVTPRGEVHAFGADGKPMWRAQAPNDVSAPPLVGRGLVLVRATDHRVAAFEADSGKRRWLYQRSQPPLTLQAPTAMAFAGDNVLVGFPGGRLAAIALSNGALRWEATVSEPKGSTEVERLADVIGPLAVAAGDVCAAAYQGRVMCADSGNGNLRWARELSAGAGVAIDPKGVYAVDARSHVQAFARETGASLWSNARLQDRGLTTPLATPHGIVVGDFAGYVHFLSASDGEFLARVAIDGSRIAVAPRAAAAGVLVQTQDGALALLALDA